MEFNIYSWANIYHFPPFLFLVCLAFLLPLTKKDRWEGKQSKKAMAARALLKKTVASLNLMGSKFREGRRCCSRQKQRQTVGPASPAPALGAATKLHARGGRWTHREQGWLWKWPLLFWERGWLTVKLSSSVSSFIEWGGVGGKTRFTPLTGIHNSTIEDDYQLFIIIKGDMAELHLLTTTVRASGLWIWHHLLLITVGICLFIIILTEKKTHLKVHILVNELLSTDWSPVGSWVVQKCTWKVYVNCLCLVHTCC